MLLAFYFGATGKMQNMVLTKPLDANLGLFLSRNSDSESVARVYYESLAYHGSVICSVLPGTIKKFSCL